jgi:hypothetical protein
VTPAQRRERIRREVAKWPPLSDEDLAAIAAAIAPGWVLEDTRAKPRRRKAKT